MAFQPKPKEQKKGLDEWMGTYGDMITLMLCFFVMLYSMSNLDVQKFTALAESYAGKPVILSGSGGGLMTDAGSGLLPEIVTNEDSSEEDDNSGMSADELKKQQDQLNKMASEFKTYLAQNDATSKIAVDVIGDYVRITFKGDMLFDSGKANLRPAAIDALSFVSDDLLKYSEHFIRVEGHTDTVPISTAQYPSNRHLSSARADTVVEYLVNEKGFNPTTLSAEGMSEYWPIDTNETPEGRANNRRVEIKVYASQTNAGISIPMD